MYAEGKAGEKYANKKMVNMQENACIGINLSKHFLGSPRC